ncbi:MAG: TolC family protein [Acidobacteria bacterium]|nr:TolC family protein [Acidobacteriota bacterium]
MTNSNRQVSTRALSLIRSIQKHLKARSLPLRLRVSAVAFLLPSLKATDAVSQTFPTPDYFRRVWSHQQIPEAIAGPEKLRDYVISGRLRLTLEDAIRLALLNNTEVKLNQLQYEGTKYSILRAHQPFDPFVFSSFNATRATSPTISQLEGAPTLSNLTQSSQSSYSQLFQTGTRGNISFNANKQSTNSIFTLFNPSVQTSMNVSLAQPLLRNRGLLPNRAPIVIAQRNVKRSRADFEASVNDSIFRAVDQYWSVVQMRENLKVLRNSLELAEATFKQNKRALELGALPPLDIYRSESQVATRRVAVIQAEYNLKQVEDALRRILGADLDSTISPLDLDFVEPAEPGGDLLTLDATEALARAMQKRPELESVRQQLANDDTTIRLAHHALQPDLTLSGLYSSSGRGGNQIDPNSVPPIVVSQGGLSDALRQLRSFDFPTYGFSLQLRLPVKDRGVQADLGNALVSKRRSLYQMRFVEQAITLEVRNAVHQLEQSKLSMSASRIARDLAQKNLEAEQRKYELGVQTIFFVLEAQTQLAQAELSLVQGQLGYQRALSAVQTATGELLERHRVEINID